MWASTVVWLVGRRAIREGERMETQIERGPAIDQTHTNVIPSTITIWNLDLTKPKLNNVQRGLQLFKLSIGLYGASEFAMNLVALAHRLP